MPAHLAKWHDSDIVSSAHLSTRAGHNRYPMAEGVTHNRCQQVYPRPYLKELMLRNHLNGDPAAAIWGESRQRRLPPFLT